MVDLPDYRLRLSRQARRGRLRVGPLGRVEVVLPAGTDPAVAPRLLAEQAEWLRRQQERVRRRRPTDADLCTSRPAAVHLPAVGERWPVAYGSGQRVRVRQEKAGIAVTAPDEAGVREGLRRWLQGRARAVLPEWAAQVGRETGLVFARVSVRGQKGRWGSCSRSGNLSLNRNLLLLGPETVRYLLVHELAHTEHPDHSGAFWSRVAELEPDYRHLDAELGRAAHRLPLWAYPDEEIPHERI